MVQFVERSFKSADLLGDRKLLFGLGVQRRQQLVLDAQHRPLALARLAQQVHRKPGAQTQGPVKSGSGLLPVGATGKKQPVADVVWPGGAPDSLSCRA